MRRYIIKGIVFVQDELGYVEDGQVKGLLRDKLDNLTIDEATLSTIFDSLYDEGILRKLFAIILKPDRSTILRRILSRLMSWRHGVDVKDPILSMKNSEIAQVLVDFFDCNVSWMKNLKTSAHGSDFSDWNLIRKTLFNSKKRSIFFPAETLPSQN